MTLIVSLEEFAELCGVTAETMRVHLRAVDGKPDWLIERGDRGRAYQIEAQGGVAWWRERRQAEEDQNRERQAQLAQLRFDVVGPSLEKTESLTLSGRQRREEIEAAIKTAEYRKMLGQLVDRAELEHRLTGAAVEHRRRLGLVPGEFAIKAGLDPDQVKPLRDIMARAIDDFLDAIGAPKPEDDDDD